VLYFNKKFSCGSFFLLPLRLGGGECRGIAEEKETKKTDETQES
jgi:hypothetical protein